MSQKQVEQLLDIQQNLMSVIALGEPLPQCLERIALGIELILPDPDVYCSILILEDQCLMHGAAPHLPKPYCEAIDGVQIGVGVGSCGTAAYTNERVVVADIEHDPLWKDYKDLALVHGLRACWSVPIVSSFGKVLGTFAIYYGHVRDADRDTVLLVERFSAFASFALERSLIDKRAQALTQALQHNSARFDSFAKAMPDLVIIFDETGNYVDIFGSQQESLILPKDMLKSRNLRDVLPPAKSNTMQGVISRCIEEQTLQTFEYELEVQSGLRVFEARVSPIHTYSKEQPELGHVIWVAQDISDRKAADDTIRKLSFYDTLTSLPNRQLLKERLATQLRKAISKSEYGAILYLDLQEFKRVNDALGVAGGDALLLEVSKRIAPKLDDRDSLARVGGDDFVILLDKTHRSLQWFSNYVTVVATKVLSAFDEKVCVFGSEFRVSARLGISIFGDQIISPEKLVNQAEAAMYRSKETGARMLFFDQEIQQSLDARIHMERDLERALSNNEITVHYQSQVLANGDIFGFEALVRWEHPEKGFVSPLAFIPLAEDLGIDEHIQDLVLRHVCGFVRVLEGLPGVAPNFRVAMNISAVQFIKDDFESFLLNVLQAFDISPSRLTLEITEGTLLEDTERVIAQMQRLRSLGFELSIDDFGTGYSSLSYLQRLPVDELKIDKSFVDGVLIGDKERSIVDAIIYLARQLDCRIVAEGVEQQEQAAYLRDQNVDVFQGYLFSKPLDVEALLTRLSNKVVGSTFDQLKQA